MKKTLLILITLFFLPACSGPVPSLTPSTVAEKPTAIISIPTITPRPSFTASPKITLTSTPWIKTYPTKQALVLYGTYWRNEYTINFIEWGDFYLEPYLILYADGQLILRNTFLEKQLSQADTDEVISKLGQLGFSQLQAAYEADPDSIYTLPADMVFNPSSPYIYITVDEKGPKRIIYEKHREEKLIQPMKDIISYLNSFSLDGATPYQPDRLLVAVAGEDVKQIPEDATIIPWPQDVTSPLHRSWMGVLYLEGTEALTLYKAAGESQFGYFGFEGKNYAVYLRPILPHECHIYHLYQLENFPEQAQPHFTCDDW